METADRKLNLIDFGMGVLAGLRLHRVNLVSDRDLPGFHGAFKAAYDTVEHDFGVSELKFTLILDELHGTTPDVERIVSYWLSSGYVTRDSLGPILRLTGFDHDAACQLIATVPGSEFLWRKAADVFLESYPGCI